MNKNKKINLYLAIALASIVALVVLLGVALWVL